MPKHRQKEEICLNCGFVFTKEDNYCPVCGQENDHKIKSILHFFHNFFSELLNLDSQIFRSIIPFLFRPGRLTLAYTQGKRKKYIPPIRLYLIMSFFYFFVFSTMISENIDSNEPKPRVKVRIKADSLETNSSKSDSLAYIKKDIKPDSISQKRNNASRQKNDADWWNDRLGDNNGNFFNLNIKQIDGMYRKEGLSEAEIISRLQIDNTFWNQLLVHRMVRMADISLKEIIKNFIEEIPLMMFFLIPVFALIIKLFYYKKYYVSHLIFTLNLHAFIFLLLGLGLLIIDFFPNSDDTVLGIAFLLMFFYSYKSFRNVYRQSRLLTFFKLFVFIIIYQIVLATGLIMAFIASFMFF